MSQDHMQSDSEQMNSLRDRVARALYEEGIADENIPIRSPWVILSAERQAPWLADADRVIPIVLAACDGTPLGEIETKTQGDSSA